MDDTELREHARQLRRIAGELDPAVTAGQEPPEDQRAAALVADRRSSREQYNGYVLVDLKLKGRTARYLADHEDRQKGDVMSLAMDKWLSDRGY